MYDDQFEMKLIKDIINCKSNIIYYHAQYLRQQSAAG